MLQEIKANAAEYEKEFNQQTKQFQSLKDQLQEAQQTIQRKDEDLQYKDMEIIRIKVLSGKSEQALQAQIAQLTKKLKIADKRTFASKVKELQEQLKMANADIRYLRSQLKQLGGGPQKDPLRPCCAPSASPCRISARFW